MVWGTRAAAAAADSRAPTPADMLTAVNKYRTAHGRRALCWSPQAAAKAQEYAQLMVGQPINQYLRGPPAQFYATVAGYLAQNLFQGSVNTLSQQPEKAMENGLSHHTTLENILSEEATHLGVGMATFVKDNDTFYYWVQVFVKGDGPCNPPQPPQSLADLFAKPEERREVAQLNPPPPAPAPATPVPPPLAAPAQAPAQMAAVPIGPPTPAVAMPVAAPMPQIAQPVVAMPQAQVAVPYPYPMDPALMPAPVLAAPQAAAPVMMMMPVMMPPQQQQPQQQGQAPPAAAPQAEATPAGPPAAPAEELPPVKSRPPEVDLSPAPRVVPPPPASELPPPPPPPQSAGPPPPCLCGASALPSQMAPSYPPGSVLERTRIPLNTVPRIEQSGLGGALPPAYDDPSLAMPSRFSPRPAA